MNKQAFKWLNLVLVVIFLSACSPRTTATSVNTTSPGPTATPEIWHAPDGWWNQQQVHAFGSQLLASYFLSEGESKPPEYYLNIYSQTGVTLVNWGDVRWADGWREEYPAIVEQLHNQHRIVVGTISLSRVAEETAFRSSLEPAALRDPYGNILEENGIFNVSSLHPAFQQYMLDVVKFYIDSGVDGILVDELAYGTLTFPDFNENTMNGFRQYMLDTYTPEQLTVLGQPYGISDFNTLDYAALVRDSLPPDRTSVSADEWNYVLRPQTPLYIDFQRFLTFKNHEFALWLISEGKAYARETYNRDISFSANINTMNNSEAFYTAPDLDYVDLEYFYHLQGYFPKGRALTAVHVAQSLGKRPYLVTGSGDTDPDIAARGIERSTNLFRVMISEAYGTGSALTVEPNLHGIQQDITALAPYYRFPVDYPYLFKDMQPSTGQVGLLYLFEGQDLYSYSDLRGLGQLLADCGYQFGVVFGAQDYTWWGEKTVHVAPDYPLTLEALQAYSLMLVPQFDNITPDHASLLIDYVNQGGKLLVFTTPDDLTNLANQYQQTGSKLEELVGYIRQGSVQVGQGKIVSTMGLWGKSYASDPQPSMRQPLVDLLTAENITPEVSLGDTHFVGAFMHESADSFTVHLVNYDYNPDTDGITPVGPLEVTITPPQGFNLTDPTVYLYSPEREVQKLTPALNDGKLTLTLPGFDIWSVLWVGDAATLDQNIASFPTSTPMPSPTPTQSAQELQQDGYVIYADALADGWTMSSYDAEVDMLSTASAADGTNAIKMDANGWGWFDLVYEQNVATAAYDNLVLYVNPADTPDLNFSVTIFNDRTSIHYVFLSAYLTEGPLQPNAWRRIVIPLNELNPDDAPFNRIFFQNESDNPATFYLDEIFLAAVP